jgi:methionyl-tRNA formyltransferase
MTARLTELGHEVAGVVTMPTQRRPELLERLLAESPVDVHLTHDASEVTETLRRLDVDLGLCSGFGRKLPRAALDAPRHGIVNGHPSLLPRWRGPNPFGWTFRAGDEVFGYTFHFMDESFDTGPVLAQGSTPLGDDDSVETVFELLAPLVDELLPQALERVEAGDRGEPQRDEGATQAPLFEDEFAEIDWTRSAREVHNQVRCWFLPTRGGLLGAHATLDGRRVRVLRTQLVGGDPGAAPGTIVARDGDHLVVQCGDAPLRVVDTAPA